MRRLTPAGVAGVACVLAEPAERAALAACLRTASDRPLSLVPGGAPRRARLLLGGRAVDDVLVVDRGEVGVELHLHGSPAVLDLLAEAFGFVAATATTPAQRLRQQAIGVEQLDLALEQEGFDFDRHLAELRRLPPAARTAAVAATIARSRAALALATPRRLVLVGAQNVGKSSLFNRLLFRERVLTGDVPGLTRDPIAEVTTLAGHPYEVVDTAGVGEFRDELEARAFAAGQRQRDGGLVLLVIDGQRGPSAADRALIAASAEPLLILLNKSDLPPSPRPQGQPDALPDGLPAPLQVSATAEPAAQLRARIGAALRGMRGLPEPGPVGGPAALDEAQWRALLALAEGAVAPRL
ncbi:MAG: 50S ribosome-binding GTPase [Planctomycetes bacterium]|nr:50S ribosome-binding GTPase [Planctomycetota bacterium]